MIGQLEIKKARSYSKGALGKDFSLRDFHYQVRLFSGYYLNFSKELRAKERERDDKTENKACFVN